MPSLFIASKIDIIVGYLPNLSPLSEKRPIPFAPNLPIYESKTLNPFSNCRHYEDVYLTDLMTPLFP